MGIELYSLIPVGVPKTPYRLPGAEDATWVDMYNVLYRERLLFLINEVQDEIAGQICSIVSNIQLEEEEDDITPINVVISSPGGSVYPGFAIYDCLVEASPPVVTWCIGMAASMASIVLLGGDLTQRLMSENARIMVHQPAASYFMASASECALESGEILRMRELITRTYRIYTGRSLHELNWLLERDSYLDAQTSQDLGLVDEICDVIPDEFWGRHDEIDNVLDNVLDNVPDNVLENVPTYFVPDNVPAYFVPDNVPAYFDDNLAVKQDSEILCLCV